MQTHFSLFGVNKEEAKKNPRLLSSISSFISDRIRTDVQDRYWREHNVKNAESAVIATEHAWHSLSDRTGKNAQSLRIVFIGISID